MSFNTALKAAKIIGVIVGAIGGIFDFIICGALGGITISLCDLWGWTDFAWWKVGVATFAFAMCIRKAIEGGHVAESRICMDGIQEILEKEDENEDDEDEDDGKEE